MLTIAVGGGAARSARSTQVSGLTRWERVMEVTVLGTGAPLAMRAATGLVITAPDCAPLLIDTCGGFELPRQLVRVGLPIDALKHVVVTHRHLDHIGGMPALFIANQPLDIYALADTQAGIQGLMAAGFPEWPIHPAVRYHTIEAGDRREIGGFTVEFFGVEHRVPTVAVRVERTGKRLAFSADSIPCDALVACAREADLFLCDALYAARDGAQAAARARLLMHPTAREAGLMATAARARALILLHLSGRSNHEHIQAEASTTFAGPVLVAEDCATYPV